MRTSAIASALCGPSIIIAPARSMIAASCPEIALAAGASFSGFDFGFGSG